MVCLHAQLIGQQRHRATLANTGVEQTHEAAHAGRQRLQAQQAGDRSDNRLRGWIVEGIGDGLKSGHSV
jgi:hypothetical protein